jgi:hypothetical protein
MAMLLVASVAQADAAKADKKSVRLVYTRLTGAWGCPAPKATEEAVAARLGYNPFQPEAKELIEVLIFAEKTGGMAATMRLVDAAGKEQGKRELNTTSRDCGELASALQLAIAIAVDPQSFMGGPAPIPAAEAMPPPPPPPPPPPLLEASPEPAPSKIHFSAGLGVVGLVGSAPQPTGGVDVRLSLAGERFSISLDGRGDLPQGLDVGPGHFALNTLMASVAPCFHLSIFGACAVVGAGAVRISTSNLEMPTDLTAPLVVGGARLRVDWNFTKRLSLAASVDGLIPITRTILTVSDMPVWTAPSFTVVGGVMLVVHVT